MKPPPQLQLRDDRWRFPVLSMRSLTTQVWAEAAIGLRELGSLELRPLHNSVRLQAQERFR